jgi:hypothetical protein
MAGLPHFKNSAVGRNLFEPLYLNQFTVIITPPGSINNNTITPLIVEHVKDISGLPEQAGTGTIAEQKYRFSKRFFAAAAPKETGAKLAINFEVNLNDANEMYIYNQFRAWANLVYDPLTGRQGLKKDYAPNGASIYVGVHNRAGDIYREFTFSPVFVYADAGGLTEEMKLDYSSEGIYTAKFNFIADSYTEVRNGQF